MSEYHYFSSIQNRGTKTHPQKCEFINRMNMLISQHVHHPYLKATLVLIAFTLHFGSRIHWFTKGENVQGTIMLPSNDLPLCNRVLSCLSRSSQNSPAQAKAPLVRLYVNEEVNSLAEASSPLKWAEVCSGTKRIVGTRDSVWEVQTVHLWLPYHHWVRPESTQVTTHCKLMHSIPKAE